MIRFQSHVPNWASTDPAVPKQEFDTIEQILSLPWVQGWNDPPQKDFAYYWSPNEGRWSKACLMAMWWDEEKQRNTWWVLGYLSEVPTSLPKWEASKVVT